MFWFKKNLPKIPHSLPCKSNDQFQEFSNSITLTPGTISVETEQGHFLVHALSYGPSDDVDLAQMDRRVSGIESEAS